ncbi:MAG: hypothetical protein OH337_04090 [Candidatus Parvarchaeota archaeon]|nr:hypothetical protein [Candidatus Haiyanarchaeum thermophilum]
MDWSKYNRLSAWLGVLEERRLNSYLVFKLEKTQRRARCRECNCLLPKDAPRVRLYESWSSYDGYYCLECALRLLLANKEEKERYLCDLQKNIEDLKALEDAIRSVLEDEKYREMMAVARLMGKIEVKE